MRGQAGVLREAQTLFSVGAVGAMSDARLLEQFLGQRGDTAEIAFEVLVRRHGPMVLRVCRDVLEDPHAAQDAFQATFLVLVRKAGGIGSRELLGNWLYGVAHRTALKARAESARRFRHERRVAEMAMGAVAEDEDRSDLAEVLHEELNRLPQTYRTVIVLCHLEGMSYATAARQLGLTEDTVRGRLARARGILRDRLSRRGALLGSGLIGTDGSQRSLAELPPDLLRVTVRESIGIASGGSCPSGAIPAGVLALTRGVLKAMLFSKLKTATWVALSMGCTIIGIRAINASAAQQRTQIQRPLRSDVGVAVPRPPELLAAAALSRSKQKRESPGGIDDALVRSVDGRIVESLPISKDCMVLSYLPDWAHGEVDNIGIANNDGGVRTLLNWRPIPLQVAGSTGRRFVLALYSRKTTSAAKTGPILAFEISGDWPERTSWTSQPDYAPEPACTFMFVPEDGWKLFDITSLVRSQAQGGAGKHGVLLRWLSEDRSGQKRDWSGYQFVSREGPGEWVGRRPLLLVVEPTKK